MSILPFLHLISNPSLIETNTALMGACAFFEFGSTQTFLIAVGVVVFIVTLFEPFMKMLTIWATTRFELMRSYSFSVRLLAIYMHQPYERSLARHSSELGNSVLSEVDRVGSDALLPAM
mgnify:CR=1 FL=1